MQIPLARIRRNPDQPRKLFDAAKLQELANSIRENGLIEPIKVRPVKEADADYELVAGERRWRACHLLADQGELPDGLIDATVQRISKRQRDIEAIVENVQREDMTPMEEARGYRRLVDQGMTPEEIAVRIGKQTWRVTDRLRLFNLAPEFIQLFESGNLSPEAVYEVSRLTSHADQARIVRLINRGELKGYNAIRAAVLAIVEGLSQHDIFAGAAQATGPELRTVKSMEQRVEQVARMVQAGFQENEVVIARKVAPDRARLMADRLELIRKHCLLMETQLRWAAAQGVLFQAN